MSRVPTRLVIVRRGENGAKLNSTNLRRVKVGCCHQHSKCPNAVKWIIDRKYYCFIHAEAFFDTCFIEEHHIIRLDSQFKEEKPSISQRAHAMQMSG